MSPEDMSLLDYFIGLLLMYAIAFMLVWAWALSGG